ncbi:unnamed protein product [Peniophora sp. CBMAI 1063]|nr:unnamed protein product [Peniophora sp. CBMAI 1063]
MPGKHNLPPSKTWGTRFDSLRTVPASPPPLKITTASAALAHVPSTPAKNTLSSNDSTVFVGSLPPNVDHVEISHRLADHLQDYADIKKVKVIRDHRGGACAFIQCKASLLPTRTPPSSSYATFMRVRRRRSWAATSASNRPGLRVPSSSPIARPYVCSTIWAMLSTLSPQARCAYFDLLASGIYIAPLYNAEAIHFQTHLNQVVEPASPFDNGGLLFAPLRYDAQTLHTIVSAFGPIEHLLPYQPDTLDGSYPSPHDALRSPVMDPTCWEVKWEQREDSMAALMALRAVPHISVSWAHLAGQRPGELLASPFTPSVRLHPYVGTPSTWISPLRIHDTRSGHMMIKPMAPLTLLPPAESDGEGETNTAAATYAPTPRASIDAGTPDDDESEPAMMGTPAAQLRRAATTPHSAVSVLASGSPVRVTASLRTIHDQAPYHEDHAASGPQHNMTAPMLTLDTAMHAATQGRVSLEEAFRALAVSRNTSADDSTTMLTPTSAAAPMETPDTPHELHQFQDSDCRDESDKPAIRSLPPHIALSTKQKLDHSTIFVGGLEMYGPNAWNEDRIQDIFGCYGEIENIKFIRPSTKKSAFAFVRFCDTESSARAVKLEHNKTYHNRQIRVQIREHNPQRPVFAFSRAATAAIAQRTQQQQPRQRWPSTEQQRAAQLQAQPMRPPLPPRHSSSSAASLAASPTRSVTSTRPSSIVVATPDPFVVNPHAQQQQHMQNQPQTATPARAPLSVQQPPTPMTTSQSQNVGQPSSAGYFVPHQYMMPPFAYQMPFAPYPNFVPPPQGHGHEAGTPPVGIPPGAQLFSYPYPVVAPALPSTERPSSASEHQRPGQIPPLMPTSFVQGEHGLMPVYSPEALDRYMHMMHAHTSGGPSTPGSHERPPYPTQAGSIPGWPGIMYGYPPPMPPASPSHAHSMSWYPPVPFGMPYNNAAPVASGTVPGQPLAPINVNALIPASCPPSVPSQPGGRAGPRSIAENIPAGESRSVANNGGGKRLTAQTRELYGDVHVPVIGAGPPPIPPSGRAPKQQHRKGSASMEVNQASPERGQNVTESRSSPLVNRAIAAQSVQAQQ